MSAHLTRMQTYRLEVRADYPNTPGSMAEDIAAEIVTGADDHDVEIVRAAASRYRGTHLVVVAVTFKAPDDATALAFRDALPSQIRWASAEADRPRTGTGRSFRWVYAQD